MWTPTTRQQHSRVVTRYQTDLTDAEWRVIVLCQPSIASDLREEPLDDPAPRVNVSLYQLQGTCPRALRASIGGALRQDNRVEYASAD
jgi:hypothetical protein